jgi:ERF superfamily
MKKRKQPTAPRVPKPPRGKLPAIFPQPNEPWMVAAMRAGLSADQIRELRIEYEAQRAYEARLAFDAAWAKAQQELPNIPKSKEVDFKAKSGGQVNYWYAQLPDVISAIRPILGKYGLAYLSSTSNTETHVTVKTVLTGFGHREEPGCTFVVPRDDSGLKNPAQGLGSAQTYGQRYSLQGACGLATADDTDGRVTNGKAAAPTISPEQTEALQMALAPIVAKDDKFLGRLLRWAKVETLQDIRADEFESVHAEILSKKSRLAQGVGGAK